MPCLTPTLLKPTFHRPSLLHPQVLSVVAQQLLTIQNALKAGLDKFWFEGRPIRLVQTCGVFITMNPVGGCASVTLDSWPAKGPFGAPPL